MFDHAGLNLYSAIKASLLHLLHPLLAPFHLLLQSSSYCVLAKMMRKIRNRNRNRNRKRKSKSRKIMRLKVGILMRVSFFENLCQKICSK
jgi:hypothetical protein